MIGKIIYQVLRGVYWVLQAASWCIVIRAVLSWFLRPDVPIYAFLLRPGFTTKASATMFSGRGVGLDVVNAAVASLGGSIRIESREYMGTTFFMEFPVVDEMHAEG